VAAVSLNSNLAALRAKRALNASSADLSSTLEHLSSGKRINHASDDAAGLAVSSTLNATARIHTQAARNVNDGISFLNLADGATSALKDILFRMRELSTQSSNGTFSNAQRQSIDKESQALQAEYGRILDTTSFNGIRVFGSGDVVVQAGVGVEAALLVNLSSGGGGTGSTTTQGDGTFQAKQSFSTGGLPYSVAVADFNGDGKSDLVTADNASNTASVLLGNGDGTFQAKQSFGAGGSPASVAVADFNGDGESDLVTADKVSNTASVLLGNGNGTFQAKQPFGTGNTPYSVAVGDFDADGVKDLVTANEGDSTVSVLLGNGTTTATTTTAYGLQPITGVSLATQADALAAQGQIDGYLDSVNKVAGTIGTALSRFQIAAHVASSVADVSQEAEARITDADTAENSAALVRNKILQQAASAILAQANQQPTLALTLLRE